VDRMLTLAKVKSGAIVFDLGSGDGRLPIATARTFGALGVGYEADPALVKESLNKVRDLDLHGQVLIEQRDIYKLDLSEADVVTLSLPPSMMERLVPQFERMKPGARIVAVNFSLPGVTPDHVEKLDGKNDNGIVSTHWIYVWTTP